jgi:ActR/RegA family two-component response regulator
LRSTLARLKAELEMAEADGTSPPVERLLEDIDEAFGHLSEAEEAERPTVRVLVVDDDERLAEITARGLRRLGFEADSAASLPGSFEGAVPVIDLGILEGADAELLAVVRAAQPIVVTGATGRASRAMAESLAATEYLLKPVELDELAAAIRRRMK